MNKFTPEQILLQIKGKEKYLPELGYNLDLSRGLKPRQYSDEQMGKTVVCSENLHVYFKSHGHDNHVIRGITLDIKRGETFAIVGESGSGKSVFTKTLSGMNESNGKIKKGSLCLKGLEVNDPRILRRKFKDSDHRKDILEQMIKRSQESINNREIESFKKKQANKRKPFEQAFNKVDSSYLNEEFKKQAEDIKKKKLNYININTEEGINELLNKKAYATLKHQNRISSFSSKLKTYLDSNKVYVVNSSFISAIYSWIDNYFDCEAYNMFSDQLKSLDNLTNEASVEEIKQNYKQKIVTYKIFVSKNKLDLSIIKKVCDSVIAQMKAETANIEKQDVVIDENLLLEVYMTIVNAYTKVLKTKLDIISEYYDRLVENLEIKKEQFINNTYNEEEQSVNDFASKTFQNEEVLESTRNDAKTNLENYNKVVNEELNVIETKCQEALDAAISRNEPLLNTPIFNEEERKFFRSFKLEDIETIIDHKLKLIDLLIKKEQIVSKEAELKDLCTKAILDLNFKEALNIQSHLGVTLNAFINSYKDIVKQITMLEHSRTQRVNSITSNKNLPEELINTRVELVNIEIDAKLNSLNEQKDSVLSKINNAITNADINESIDVELVNEQINGLFNFVKPSKISLRHLIDKVLFRQDLVKVLKKRGVIVNDEVDLVKLKTNKEWSMIRGSKIATIFQDPMTSLNPLLRIGEQIAEVLRIHHNLSRKEAKKEAISILNKVKIPNPEQRYYDYPFQYSGGMRQRVVIAIALACRPDILICDEPTTALDVTVQAQILSLIKDLQKDYKFTTIFITHDLGVVAGVADRIGVMYGGQIIEYGTAEDVFYRPAHPYTWALLSSLPQLAVNDEPLSYIRGNPPSFNTEIQGDAFAPRSQYAMRIDFIKEPPMQQLSPTHFAKIWLADKRAPKVEKPLLIRNLEKRMQQTAKEFLVTPSEKIQEELEEKEHDNKEEN